MRARLLSVPEGENRKVVLEVELEDGWHSYGQDPGDAGLPPRFDWKGSINFQSANVYGWPETFEKREMDIFSVNAYEGRVQYEMSITPEDPKSDVGLKLNLNLMVCKDICIPSKVDLTLDLKAAPTKP